VWSGWGVLAPLDASTPLAGVTVGQNRDGRLEVFALGMDGTVRHIWQSAPNNGWSSWASLGEASWTSPTTPVVGQNQDGHLELFVLDSGGMALWHIWQESPGNSTS
jgi:hypothetical protein